MKILFPLIVLITLVQVNALKFNYPRVLLPVFNKISINFTLEVIEKGCFRWTSSRHDLIMVTPVYLDNDQECAYKAVVTALSHELKRQTALVIAEDLRNGEVLRCDVILDAIHNLEVLTTTRELFLEEAPETFELLAQDAQGNAFTSLEGVEFAWRIESQYSRIADPGKNEKWKEVLRFLSFTESEYHEVPKTLEKFEKLGLKGFMILLEGINSGSARVSVKLPYTEYSHIEGLVVDITILANIIIDPLDIHMLVDDTIPIRILQIKQGKQFEISLNDQYYLEIADKTIARIENGNFVTALKIGSTSVILRDRNVPNEGGKAGEDIKTPSPRAKITVTKADKIVLNLLPYNNWITTLGERHQIAVDLFTRNDRKIILGSKFAIQSTYDASMYYSLHTTNNGSRIYGETMKIGDMPIESKFDNLIGAATMQIFDGLELIPQSVILPYEPRVPNKYLIQFHAIGGDGVYTWTSLSDQITINPSGLADINYNDNKKEITNSQIKLSLSRNSKISKIGNISFLKPVKLEIIKYNFETALNDLVHVHIGLFALENNEYVPITLCDNLHFVTEFSNHIFEVESRPIPNDDITSDVKLANNACKVLPLRASRLGNTQLTLSYSYQGKVLKDEAMLNVFLPLQILNPTENKIILPIGASRNIIYSNGPQKLYNIEAELSKTFNYDQKIAKIVEVPMDGVDRYAYNILCRKVGETDFKLHIYNQMSKKNYSPYISEFITTVYCVKPRFINLYTTQRLKDSCPLQSKKSLMQVHHNDENLEIGIEVLDDSNRKLMNISSLILEWEFSDSDRKLTDVRSIQQSEEDYVENLAVPVRDYLQTSMMNLKKLFKVKVEITEYNEDVLNQFKIKSEYPQFGIRKSSTDQLEKPVIENEITFLAVNSTLLPFDSVSVYLAKNRPERIKVNDGSGFYEFQLSENGIVSVEYDEIKQELLLTPIKIGEVKLDLIDRCLTSTPTRLFVSVVTIGRIELRVTDRIQKNKAVEAIVQIYDSNDHLLPIDHSNLGIYELTEEVYNPKIIAFKLGEQYNLNIGEIRYYVTGLELGKSKLVVHSGKSEMKITSTPATIEVFSPLRLHPRNSTLIIGSSIQIYSEGGPHPDVNIIFTVHKENVISIDSAIALALRLGDTKITGKAVGINQATGQQTIYSEDSIHIYVVPLESIKIKTPLVRITSGAITPASIWGVPNLSPMVLGTMDAINVYWTVDEPDIVDIRGIFSEAGIEYTEKDMISVRIKGLNPGRTKIRATLILSNGVKYTSFIEVSVFKNLRLEHPKIIEAGTILLPPNSNMQLISNLDGTIYSLNDQNSGIIKVTREGIVKTSEALGRDSIIASSEGQTLSIPIEVKPIHYVLTRLQPTEMKLVQSEHKLPQGLTFMLKVSLHDNLGNEFYHNFDDMNILRHRLSNKEAIDVNVMENMTISLNLQRETSNMLEISLKKGADIKYAEDYVKLNVGKSKNIYPTRTIFSEGDIICFDSPLTTDSGWFSSNNKVLTVDKTGLGYALSSNSKSGDKVQVINGNVGQEHIMYNLDIRVADKIEFLDNSDTFNGEKLDVPVMLRNHLQVDKFTNLNARNATRCQHQIDPSIAENFFGCYLLATTNSENSLVDYFKVRPTFAPKHGSYACQIESVISVHDLIKLLKNNESSLELQARLSNGLYDSIDIRIVPEIKTISENVAATEHQVLGECSQRPLSSFFVNALSNFGLLISAVIVLGTTIWIFIKLTTRRQEINNAAYLSFKEGSSPPTMQHSSPYVSAPFRSVYPSQQYPVGQSNISGGSISPIYGDTTLSSPQKRVSRRFL